EQGGLATLGRPRGFPAGRKRIDHSRDKRVSKLRAEGKSLRQIADAVGVSEKAIRKQLRRLGWPPVKPAPAQIALPIAADLNVSGPAAGPDVAAASAAETADPNLSGSPATGDDGPVDFTTDREP